MPTFLASPIVKILAVLALVAAILFGVNSFVNKEREAGAAECRSEVATATADGLDKLRDAERLRQDSVSSLQSAFNEKIRKLENEKITNLAAVRAGTLKLRDTNGTCPAGRAEAPASASGDSKAAGCELSTEASEFLLNEAARADEVVLQLKAAQELLQVDRKFINGD